MKTPAMPFPIYIMGFTLFAMTTSEYMIAGLMTSMSVDLGVSIPAIGYLITVYSLGMVVGGPLLAACLVRLTNKAALLVITALFIAATAVATLAQSYSLLAAGRFFAGLVSAAFFGFALLATARLVPPSRFGLAASIVLGGMMIATVAGLPISTLLDRFYGWRMPFIFILILTALAGLAIAGFVPQGQSGTANSLRAEVASLCHKAIWAAYSTSFFVIAGTFAAFSYFVPYFEKVAGFDPVLVPAILFAYGACTVIGNVVVGRLADNAPIKVTAAGIMLLIAALLTLYGLHQHKALVLCAVMLLGLTGLTLTPAMSARVFNAAPNTSLINTVHTSVICLGVVLGSWFGGLAIDHGYGYRAPLLIGLGFAVCALLSVLPALRANRVNPCR